MEKNIEIYTSPTCHFCHDLKSFLDEKGVKYSEKVVGSDESISQELLDRSGQMGVPVVFINEEMIVGFDKAKIEEELNK